MKLLTRSLCALLAWLMPALFCLSCTGIPTSVTIPGDRLHENDGAGEFYCQELYFFGESTTAHLSRVGGVLDTPQYRSHVLRDASGTRMLDRRILASPVLLYEHDGSARTVPLTEALEVLRPPILMLSFGLNGILGFCAHPEQFEDIYLSLLQGIRTHSPETEIILQSIYPVRASDGYSVDVPTLNAHICALNERIRAMAAREGLRYADTAALLCDKDGLLCASYDSGDGIHLCNDAYRAILAYLTENGYASKQKGIK